MRQTALITTEPLNEGIRLRYRRSADIDAELQRLVDAEHVCCGAAGIQWRLELGTNAVVTVDVPTELRGSAAVRIIGEVISGSPTHPS